MDALESCFHAGPGTPHPTLSPKRGEGENALPPQRGVREFAPSLSRERAGMRERFAPSPLGGEGRGEGLASPSAYCQRPLDPRIAQYTRTS
jgi:hypothetical protein